MTKAKAPRRSGVTGKAVAREAGVIKAEGQTEAVPPSQEETMLPSEPRKVMRRTRKKEKGSAEVQEMSDERGQGGVDVISLDVITQAKECAHDDADKKTSGNDEDIANQTVKNVNGKRKAHECKDGTSPKKAKSTNKDFCVFVSNLNNTKTYDEVKDSLTRFLLKQGLLVQEISLDPSRKYAYLDLATEMDLTKALALNGKIVLNRPIKVRKPNIKEDDANIKAASEAKKAKYARSVFVKNVPCNATKKDILKVFDKAVGVRFPGRTIRPSKGFAIVEFETKDMAEQVLNTKEETKIEDNVLILECIKEEIGKNSKPTPVKAQVQSPKSEVESNILFLNNMPFKLKQKGMKIIFKKAVKITLSKVVGPSNRFAFVEFKTVEDAKEAMEITKSKEMTKRTFRVEFCNAKRKPANINVVRNSLIVKGLSEEMDKETLKDAFEGSTSARIIADKKTGVCRGIGFVDFEHEEDCSAALESMKDCRIGGRRVTLAYAKARAKKGPRGPGGRRLHPKLSQDGVKKEQVKG